MKCPRCASENRENARYCRNCGKLINPPGIAGTDASRSSTFRSPVQGDSYVHQNVLDSAGKRSPAERMREGIGGAQYSITVPSHNKKASKRLPDLLLFPSKMVKGLPAPKDGATGASVFISYSRKDEAFVQKLKEALEASNHEVWLDRTDIPLTAEWRKEIQAGIEGSDNIVCVLSPDFIASRPCAEEVAYAVAGKKRLVPILYRQVDTTKVDPALEQLNWIQFCDKNFDTVFKDFIKALDSDLDYIHMGTHLQAGAREWKNKTEDADTLPGRGASNVASRNAGKKVVVALRQAYNPAVLRGRDLDEASSWLKEAAHRGDDPIGLVKQYVQASRRATAIRQRIILSAVSIALTVIIVSASVAQIGFQRAQTQSRLAAMQKAVATSRQLATQATNHLDDNLDLALLLSVEANHIQSTLEARNSLLRALEHQPHLAALLPSLSAGIGNSIAFSPDGKMLAVGGQNQTFTLWDMASRRPLLPPIRDQLILRNDTVGQVPIPVNSLAFSPDGKLLATGTSLFGGTFRLWDVQSKQLISPPISVPRGVSGLAFNPMGTILAVGSTNGTFSLWDVASQRPLSTHRSWRDVGDPDAIYSDLVFSPDGQFLAVGNNDIGFSLPATFTLWDMRSQQLLGTHLMGGSSLWGNSLSFSLDSKILAVGGDNGSATLWNVKSQSPLGVSLTNTNISKVDAPASGFIPDSSLVAFSPAGRILAVGSSSGTITLWDTATHQLVDEIKTNSSLADMIFSPDGSLLATIGDGSYTATLKGSYISLWHVLPIQPLARLMIGASKSVKPAFRPDGTVLGLNGGYDTVVSPDGHTIAMKYCSDSSCTNPTIRIWSMVSRQQMGEAFTGFPPGMGMGPAIALSPHATFLAVAGCHTQGCTSGELQIWNVATHQFLGNPILTDLPLGRVAYSQDGKILAAYGDHILGNSSGDMIYLWDGATGRFLGSIGSIESYGRSFVFMSDNDTLIAPYCAQFSKGACDHIQIGLWDSQNPTNRKRIINGAGMQSPDYLLLSPRGDILVASDQNNVAFLWDIANSKLIAKLDVSYPFTFSVFTPDGTMLFTGSQLLDINTLTPVGPPLSVYTNYLLEEMQTSDDTNPLYGWSIRDGLVVSWDFNVDSWQTLACQMANRNLTLSEWKQFIGSMPYSKICPGLS